MEEEDVFVLIEKIELADKKLVKNKEAHILYKLKEGSVYRARKLSDIEEEGVYVLFLDDDVDMMEGIMLDKYVLDDPETNSFPLKSISFEEVSPATAHEFKLDRAELKKMLKWIKINKERYEDGFAEDDYQEQTIATAKPRINKQVQRMADHPSFDIPMDWVKFKLYELRDSNPDLFLNIVGIIRSSL